MFLKGISLNKILPSIVTFLIVIFGILFFFFAAVPKANSQEEQRQHPITLTTPMLYCTEYNNLTILHTNIVNQKDKEFFKQVDKQFAMIFVAYVGSYGISLDDPELLKFMAQMFVAGKNKFEEDRKANVNARIADTFSKCTSIIADAPKSLNLLAV